VKADQQPGAFASLPALAGRALCAHVTGDRPAGSRVDCLLALGLDSDGELDRPETASPRAGDTVAGFQQDLVDNLCYQRGTTVESASAHDAYWTLAVTIRDRLAERRARTAEAHYVANPKFVYYLSAEYMLGRQLRQNALYTGTAGLAGQALAGVGVSASALEALDVEPGLGNGGLGRLAACLLDSLATLDIPAVGYGIRYEFGIFK